MVCVVNTRSNELDTSFNVLLLWWWRNVNVLPWSSVRHLWYSVSHSGKVHFVSEVSAREKNIEKRLLIFKKTANDLVILALFPFPVIDAATRVPPWLQCAYLFSVSWSGILRADWTGRCTSRRRTGPLCTRCHRTYQSLSAVSVKLSARKWNTWTGLQWTSVCRCYGALCPRGICTNLLSIRRCTRLLRLNTTRLIRFPFSNPTGRG